MGAWSPKHEQKVKTEGRGVEKTYFTGFYHSFAKVCKTWVWLGLLTFECVAAHSSGVDGEGPGVAFAEWRWLMFSGWPGLSGEGEWNSPPARPVRSDHDIAAFLLSVA